MERIQSQHHWLKKAQQFFPTLAGLFLLIVLLLVSFTLRQTDFTSNGGAQNLEATYHVLLTVTALNENPAQNHWYLPTVSLGKDADKHIAWGGTIPTQTGDYIYTSFTPLGFLAPYAWFKAFSLEPTIYNLAVFNTVLGGVTALGLFLLMLTILRFHGYPPWTAMAGALTVSAIAIFSREVLSTHGVIYWSHSLYQLVLVSSLYAVFQYVTRTNHHAVYAVALVVLSFIGALLEWTGYVFNIGLMVLFWLDGATTAGSRKLAIQLFIATFLAGIVTIAHYSLAAGFLPTIEAFVRRFFSRSAVHGNPFKLLLGYYLSYGFFLVTAVGVGLISLTRAYRKKTLPSLKDMLALKMPDFLKSPSAVLPTGRDQQAAGHKTLLFLLMVACIPLLENMVMLQHATQFSFDRLKFIFPAALLLLYVFAYITVKERVALAVLMLLASIHGYSSYQTDRAQYAAWQMADAENQALAAGIRAAVDTDCALFASPLQVRGYGNLLFQHGIHELKSDAETAARGRDAGACATVYVEGTLPFPDMPHYTKATIRHTTGETVTVPPQPMVDLGSLEGTRSPAEQILPDLFEQEEKADERSIRLKGRVLMEQTGQEDLDSIEDGQVIMEMKTR